MNIYYFGQGGYDYKEKKLKKETFLALFWDKWDDFGNKTQFPSEIVINGEAIDFRLYIKILIPGVSFTGNHLEKKLQTGWKGEFPIPDESYVSIPSDISFYEILVSKLGYDHAVDVLIKLKDAGFLHNVINDLTISETINSKPFHDSLMRESGAIKAFQDGWKLFNQNQRSIIENFKLNIPSSTGNTWSIDFKFNSEILPYDINIIIGPNGIGKSFCLKSFVEYWLKIDRGNPKFLQEIGHQPFDKHPNLERLILISYSPFEEFAVDFEDKGLLDTQVYKYFGFRKKGEDENGQYGIKISRNLPASDSVLSIIECLREDVALGFIRNREKKVTTAFQVLKEAIEFDDLIVQIKSEFQPQIAFDAFWPLGESVKPHLLSVGSEMYLRISQELLTSVTILQLNELVDLQRGVLFLKNREIVELSSGQRLFSYIVINILGSIRNNSMVIIDEPELFLHPNLEITLIQLLKDLLLRYASKAIIATHSLVTVREVPANCIHVLRKIDSERDVARPPFETFGGDIQRISSYVFGDRSVSKPFETWLEAKMSEYENVEEFMRALGQEVNEEMILKINFNARSR